MSKLTINSVADQLSALADALHASAASLRSMTPDDTINKMLKLQDDLERATLRSQWRPLSPERDISLPISENRLAELTTLTDTLITAIIHEAVELRDWLPWKHWSKRPGNKSSITLGSMEHIAEIHMELIDMLHFWLALCLLWGLDAESISELYLQKHETNRDRQADETY
jgi:hypothetical protein